MEQTRVLVEKLERIFVERIGPRVTERELDGMSLGELFYYALLERGDDRGLMRQRTMVG